MTRQAEEWAEDEIGKQALGEDFGYAISLQQAMVATPQGPAAVPMWALLLTTRSPVLKEGPLYHGPAPVGSPAPVEAELRAQVTEGMRLLRELARSRLTAGNGHGKLAGKR
jgi:hypothetical protein